MVAEHGSRTGTDSYTHLLNLRLNDNTLYTTKPLSDGAAFHISKWNPRTGRTKQFQVWWNGLLKLLAALGVDRDFLSSTPPEVPEYRTKSEREATETAIAARRAWIVVNTSLYWHAATRGNTIGQCQVLYDVVCVTGYGRDAHRV